MKCKNCQYPKLKKIIDIGKQPISSVFLSKKNNKMPNFLLDLFLCEKCNLVQFSSLAPLDDMYGTTYGYRTSLSKLMIRHIEDKYKKISNKSFLKNNSNILDIGSNDGTFLNFFNRNKLNLNLFGIDPSAKKFQAFYNKKINLIVDFFSKSSIDKFFKEKKIKNQKFSLISSFAMFYDIEDPNSFCKDINNLLNKDGMWILEFSYFPLLLKNLTYDQICHEHVTYYSLTTFNNILKKNGLKIYDFSFNEINGGSIEVMCVKKESKLKIDNKKIQKIFDDEKRIDQSAYSRFNQRVENTKNVINLFLNSIKKNEIIGYGASTKGNIVLNHCGINSKNLPLICDENIEKHGKYTPGSNIKIISKQQMRKLQPKYLFVLIWSFRQEVIMQEEEYIKKGGKLIFHLPILHIIDKSNYKKFIKEDFKSFSYDY